MPSPPRLPERFRFAPAIVAVLLAGTIPVLLPGSAWALLRPLRDLPVLGLAFAAAGLSLPFVAAWLSGRALRRGGEPALLAGLFLVLALLQEYTAILHIDRNNLYEPSEAWQYPNNVLWQFDLQQKVVALSPEVLPHSYRFLSNGLVELLRPLIGNFILAKTVYRVTFSFGALCLLYLYARPHLSRIGAVAAVGLFGFVLPVGLAFHAGQMADPLSHFSFLLALLFIRLRRDFDLAATLAVGLLAKESLVLVVPVYVLAALRRGDGVRAWVRGAGLAALAGAVLLWARWLVLRGGNGGGYEQISGVGARHAIDNLSGEPGLFGVLQALFAVGVFLPVLVVHWRRLPADLRDPIAIFTPGLLLSNLLFSWLQEARNYMPLSALLCVAAVHFLEDRFRSWEASGGARDADAEGAGDRLDGQ